MHFLSYAYCNNPYIQSVNSRSRKFTPRFGLREDYRLKFVQAHDYLRANTDMKLMSGHTTVNDIQMAGCLDLKIFVNCLLYVQDEAFDKDLQVKTRVETNAKVGLNIPSTYSTPIQL